MSNKDIPILIIDDDELFVEYLQTLLEGFEYSSIQVAYTGNEGLSLLSHEPFGLVLLDLILPDIPGIQILQNLHKENPNLPIVVITAKDTVETAVECMKLGAFDFLTKPVSEAHLLPILHHAVTIRDLRQTLTNLQQGAVNWRLRNPEAFRTILTRSELMLEVFIHIEAIAPTPKAVLISGESGTGKELIARTIHTLSGTKGRFIPVNIAGLDDPLFSDTLFGHTKGAFTGANTERNGLVAEASEGTLFLDEIGDLEPPSQVKLLRLLQEGEYYRLGSDIPEQSTARILTATNIDLLTKVKEGRFRSDLYYRLVAHRIELPPLRSRREDIPVLAEAIVERASEELKKPKPTIPDELILLLQNYRFPGNIRELQSLLYDAVSRTDEEDLNIKPISAYIEKQKESVTSFDDERSISSTSQTLQAPLGISSPFRDKFPTLAEVANTHIREALRTTGGNQSLASKLLGISQSTLSRWIRRQGNWYAK